VTQHTYIGGNPRKRGIDQPHAVENMLSRAWVTNNYPELYRTVLKPVQEEGLPFRITELDDHVHGVDNASDAFVSALWTLDCMHWWARHGASGVNFQNTEWLRTDTFYLDANTNYQMHVKAYGIRAFDLGSRGKTISVGVENKEGLNLTAYAVAGGTNLFVTIINKEHGTGRRNAKVRILPEGFAAKTVEVMFLVARDGSVEATDGVTLGGGTISNSSPWKGTWKTLEATKEGCVVTVGAASAAVVRMAGEGGR
ncbi:MAG TPA: glycosyl hydrolase family 79 C-terminal domain-containing protein, partial [Candidatus Eisenbacteria bacterium]|nr:glycosyl hydrolase family 79 C-terminal domain-containing protein [Candidatus Eisenbacteria bacterium]